MQPDKLDAHGVSILSQVTALMARVDQLIADAREIRLEAERAQKKMEERFCDGD